MNAIVLQENLNRALSFVGKAVSTRTQLPVLSNVLMETEEGKIIFSSTNLETSISLWIGASINENGNITVPARIFTETVSHSHKPEYPRARYSVPRRLATWCAWLPSPERPGRLYRLHRRSPIRAMGDASDIVHVSWTGTMMERKTWWSGSALVA